MNNKKREANNASTPNKEQLPSGSGEILTLLRSARLMDFYYAANVARNTIHEHLPKQIRWSSYAPESIKPYLSTHHQTSPTPEFATAWRDVVGLSGVGDTHATEIARSYMHMVSLELTTGSLGGAAAHPKKLRQLALATGYVHDLGETPHVQNAVGDQPNPLRTSTNEIQELEIVRLILKTQNQPAETKKLLRTVYEELVGPLDSTGKLDPAVDRLRTVFRATELIDYVKTGVHVHTRHGSPMSDVNSVSPELSNLMVASLWKPSIELLALATSGKLPVGAQLELLRRKDVILNEIVFITKFFDQKKQDNTFTELDQEKLNDILEAWSRIFRLLPEPDAAHRVALYSSIKYCLLKLGEPQKITTPEWSTLAYELTDSVEIAMELGIELPQTVHTTLASFRAYMKAKAERKPELATTKRVDFAMLSVRAAEAVTALKKKEKSSPKTRSRR